MKKALPYLLICTLLAVWEACVHGFSIPLYVLPAPTQVISAFFTDLPALARHALVSMAEALYGMGIALALSLLLVAAKSTETAIIAVITIALLLIAAITAIRITITAARTIAAGVATFFFFHDLLIGLLDLLEFFFGSIFIGIVLVSIRVITPA